MNAYKIMKSAKVPAEYVIAGILILYTFFAENILLNGNVNYIVRGGVKTFLFFLCVSFVKEIKRVNLHKNRRQIFSVVLTYLLINMIVFRFIYPGNWCGDELWMLPNVINYNIISAQHWLTACFYIASFMLFPSPIGVFLLFQAVIIYILMYALRVLSDRLNHKKYVWWILVSICTGNVLLYNFYPLRCSIYGWLLVLFFVSVFLDKERNIPKIITSSIFICSLRSEGIVWLIVIGCILFLRKCKRKQIWIMAVIVCLSGMISKYQSYLFSSTNGDHNLVIATLDPMKKLIAEEYEKEGLESRLLSRIDETLDVDVLLTCDGSGKGIFFSHYEELFRNEKPVVTLNYIKAYVRLIVKYPVVFLHERKSAFINTMKQTSLILCNNTQTALSDDNKEPYVYLKYLNGFQIKNARLRKYLLDFLSLKNSNVVIRQICTGLFFPLCFIFIGIFCRGRKQKWDEVIFLMGIWMYMAIVFFTMPGVEFMYYYPIYLFGSFYGNIIVVEYWDQHKLLYPERQEGA